MVATPHLGHQTVVADRCRTRLELIAQLLDRGAHLHDLLVQLLQGGGRRHKSAEQPAAAGWQRDPTLQWSCAAARTLLFVSRAEVNLM